MAKLVDTHCHIDLYPNPAAVLAETEAQQIYTIAVTNTPSVFPHTEAMCKNLQYVRPAVGLHPELAVARQKELSQMWDLLPRTRYVGEIGLDFTTRDSAERKVQVKVFEEILSHCASYGNKVLTIHSRRAATEVINAIGKGFPGSIILHWYSGSSRDLERAVESGYFFSVNTAMLRSQKGRTLVARIPRERVLTETDGPFITLAQDVARPKDVALVVAMLADMWAVGADTVSDMVTQNFRTILTGR